MSRGFPTGRGKAVTLRDEEMRTCCSLMNKNCSGR